MEDTHDCIVTQFGEEVETKAILNTTGTSSPLGSVALGDIGLDQSTHLSLLIEPHLAMFTGINDTGDVWNCDSSLRNVGRFRWDQYTRRVTLAEAPYLSLSYGYPFEEYRKRHPGFRSRPWSEEGR